MTTLVIGFEIESRMRLIDQTKIRRFEDFIRDVIKRHMQVEGHDRLQFYQGHEENYDPHQNEWLLTDDASIETDADNECKLPRSAYTW
jgi:hypothetical protein